MMLPRKSIESIMAGAVLGLEATRASAAPDANIKAQSQPEAALPNVITIITDDQGWADIGYNNPKAYTPNLDSLAARGVIFTHNYSMPQCTPTRVALFTGRYPGRFGVKGLQATNAPVFPEGTETLATMFKSRGYETSLVGKWHMGSAPEHGPNHFGFDRSYGSLAGAIGMYDHRYRPDSPYGVTWHRDHEIIPGYENGKHATDLVAEEAIRIIRKERTKPFFMYLAFHAPHTPLDERGDFVDRPTRLDPDRPGRWLDEDKIRWFNDPEGKIQSEADPEKRLFLAAIHHLDHALGQVVDALKETGQWENTLILFTSDNGPQVNWPGNAYPDDLKLSNFNQPIPMRGHKCDVWEGGVHVPGFAVWPARIKPGKMDIPVHVVDWFPTLAGIVDYHPEETLGLDGADFSPMLLGSTPPNERDFYWIWGERTNRWALRYGDWKIVKYGPEEPKSPADWQLFNLAADPREQHNAAARNAEIVAELHRRFEKHRARDK